MICNKSTWHPSSTPKPLIKIKSKRPSMGSTPTKTHIKMQQIKSKHIYTTSEKDELLICKKVTDCELQSLQDEPFLLVRQNDLVKNQLQLVLSSEGLTDDTQYGMTDE